MYDKRIKVFVGLVATLFLLCLLRLVQMQLLSGSYYADEVAKLKKGTSRPLKTIRGRILDRNGKVLAADEPRFQLCIKYRLTCLLDERVRHKYSTGEFEDKLADLHGIIEKCARFKGVEPSEIETEIQTINNSIWNQRAFHAWRTNFADSDVIRKYPDIRSVPFSEAMADFERRCDPDRRLDLINKTNIAEMHASRPLLELQTDDDIFTAQLEFLSIDDVVILPKGRRSYPYGSAAAQTIGWVGGPQEHDKELFADDRLASYLEDDVSGREDGVEYVCETILRGRRGEVVYDIDKKLVSRTPTQFGRDVRLTLDIELQQTIESYIADCNKNPNNCRRPTAAVVIDVDTADILALVSLPVFDVNRARYDWSDLNRDPNEPLRNRAINEQYPPGSVAKPIILIAGLESGAITPGQIISCPAQPAPKGWPNCWIYNRFRGGHDIEARNTPRNAIKGSCNIYFSRLANRIDPAVLQQWLFKFGYGAQFPLAPVAVARAEHYRNLRQVPGIISTRIPPRNTPFDFDKFQIAPSERRFFGIGQGNLRVTPLQVANAMAAIARRGQFKLPRLFIEDPNHSETSSLTDSVGAEVALSISPRTLDIIYDGMSAVVNEQGGTAATAFAASGLAEQGVKVYGKTGSTEEPETAWFAGFATDTQGRSISIAVVVEGGQHGSTDAAPLAKEIIRFCADEGYIGGPTQ
ncbi:MAG: peptidoglycan D,D-transpeptidase FtsI family protein [Planctomycetota bacterium]|jgi:penicillin-binding protein 2